MVQENRAYGLTLHCLACLLYWTVMEQPLGLAILTPILVFLGWYVISAESYVDRTTTLPDILALAPKITCPVLYVRGSLEPKDVYPAEAYAERAGGPRE